MFLSFFERAGHALLPFVIFVAFFFSTGIAILVAILLGRRETLEWLKRVGGDLWFYLIVVACVLYLLACAGECAVKEAGYGFWALFSRRGKRKVLS